MKVRRKDGNSEDILFSGRGNFKVFVPMINHLLTALQKRLEAYDAVSSQFSYLSKMPMVNSDQMSDGA